MLQELNVYLGEFPRDTSEQEAPLTTEKIMDIIYHSMPTTWKNKMIELGFQILMSKKWQFFLDKSKNLELKEDEKKPFASFNKRAKKNDALKERERNYSNFVEYGKEYSIDRPVRKYCILHGKYSHTWNNCIYLRALVQKFELKTLKPYTQCKILLNTFVEKKFQRFFKNKKRRKAKKISTFTKITNLQ